MHFIIIASPSQLVLDEEHYISDARNIIEEHETLCPEHLPLGKLFVATGITLFGDNPWGWRLFSIIFGTTSIVLFYFLCRRLTMSRTASSIATFLLALENMTFIQASIAMLDVYYLTFMIGAFLLYFRRKYIASGITVGLSALAKLSGALALPAIIIHWFFARQGRSRRFILTVILAPIAFLGLMYLFDFAIVQRFTALVDPITRIMTMFKLMGTVTFSTTTYEAASRPWEWILSYKTMAYYFTPHYTGAISFSIWALIIPTVIYMGYRAVKGNEAGLFGVAWFASTYLLWIPASIITDRLSYVYYFYPTVGAVCLGLGVGLSELINVFRERKSGKLKWTALSLVTVYLLIHLASFVILAPVFPVNLST